MQFGIFTVSDITHGPDHRPDADRGRADQGRPDHRARRPRRSGSTSSPSASTTTRRSSPPPPPRRSATSPRRPTTLQLSTSTTLITTNDPVKIAEDYAMLQHLADGRVDLMMGRGNTGPVYPWFGKDIRDGIELADRELRACCAGCGARTSSTGRASSARRCRASPRPRARSTASRRSSGTARSAARRSPSRPPTTATASSPTTSSGRRSTPSGWSSSTAGASSTTATAAPTRRSSASAARCSCARTARTRSSEFRPYFDNAPVYGHGPSLEEFTAQTPLTVGSPQQVIERTLGFRDYVGDYQRQLFLIDHAGLPLKTVLEQLDLLGEEVVPVLRKEFAALKPAHVPDAPTHASLWSPRPAAPRTPPSTTPPS